MRPQVVQQGLSKGFGVLEKQGRALPYPVASANDFSVAKSLVERRRQ